MATPAQYHATDEDVSFLCGVPAPQPEALRLDLVPQQFPRETVTLRQQSQRWFWNLDHKREKLAPSTLVNYRSSIKRIFEIWPTVKKTVGNVETEIAGIAETKIVDIDSETLRVFVTKASAMYSLRPIIEHHGRKPDEIAVPTKALSATSINQLLVILRLIISSAKDHRGKRLFDLKEFNSEHIDAPKIGEQERPCFTASDVETLIAAAKSQSERLLYCVLAATGLRISELQACGIGPENATHSTWDYSSQCFFVRSSCFRNRELPRLKTKAAKRTVHVHSSVNEMIAQFVGNRKTGYLFQDGNRDRPVRASEIRRNLSKRLAGATAHAFRRYRATFLRTQARLLEDVLKFELGHGDGRDITNRYVRPSDECRAAIEAAGIGFKILGENNESS